MIIPNKLRKLRMLKEYSQEAVAEELGVSQKTYSNMENGKTQITLQTLKKLADLYDFPFKQLISSDLLNIHDYISLDDNILKGDFLHHHLNAEYVESLKQQILDLRERVNDLKDLIAEKDAKIKLNLC